MIQAVGEELDTWKPTRMWAIFDRAYEESVLNELVVSNRRPLIYCRTSDVIIHELVKDSRIERVDDGSVWFVKDFEDDGTGVTVIVLRV
jgi:hypothetical protein